MINPDELSARLFQGSRSHTVEDRMIYVIVKDKTLSGLGRWIQVYLDAGYKPLGGVVITRSFFGKLHFYQSLIKDRS